MLLSESAGKGIFQLLSQIEEDQKKLTERISRIRGRYAQQRESAEKHLTFYQSNQQGSENFMYYILCDANNVVSFFFLLNGTVAIPGRGSLQEAAGGVVCQGGPDGGPGQRHSAHVASPSGAWFSSFFPTAAAAAFLPCRPPLHLRRPRGLVAFLCAAHVDSLAGPVGF